MPETGLDFFASDKSTGPEIVKVKKADLAERRRRAIVRWTSIKAERSRQWSKWIDLTDYIMPERGRFLATNHNQPKYTGKILNGTPTRMAKVCAAGLMSGCTPRARPWLNMTLADRDLAEFLPVKRWLWELTRRLRYYIEQSGFYMGMSQGVYPDLVTYGLASMLQEEDPETVMRFQPLAIGSYGLAQDGKQQIDCIQYEQPWTVAELVKEFGWDKVSSSVRAAWNGGAREMYVMVLRTIEPNSEFLPGSFGKDGMKWGSHWMEMGGVGSSSGSMIQPSEVPAMGFLREGAYEEFPLLCARWATTDRDVYPTGPGHDALPDAKMLMKAYSRFILGLDKGVNPPMLIPDSMRNDRLSMLPGDPVYVREGSQQKIEPAQVVQPQFLSLATEEMREIQSRISSAFFADLMRHLTQDDPNGGKQPQTAAWVSETKQEIMQQLGPVMDNMNHFLTQMVVRSLGIMKRRKLLPPIPDMIKRLVHGQRLVPEFVSVLFQAQRFLDVQVQERAAQYLGNFATMLGPQKGADVFDIVDVDKWMDSYLDALGISPDVVTLQSVRDKFREDRQKQQAALAQAQMQAQQAATAKDASRADLSGDNVLSRLAGPAAGAQAGEPS